MKCCENRPFITLNNAHRKVQIPRIITDKVSLSFCDFCFIWKFYIFTLENVLNYAKWNCANIQSIRTTKVFVCQFMLWSFEWMLIIVPRDLHFHFELPRWWIEEEENDRFLEMQKVYWNKNTFDEMYINIFWPWWKIIMNIYIYNSKITFRIKINIKYIYIRLHFNNNTFLRCRLSFHGWY